MKQLISLLRFHAILQVVILVLINYCSFHFNGLAGVKKHFASRESATLAIMIGGGSILMWAAATVAIYRLQRMGTYLLGLFMFLSLSSALEEINSAGPTAPLQVLFYINGIIIFILGAFTPLRRYFKAPYDPTGYDFLQSKKTKQWFYRGMAFLILAMGAASTLDNYDRLERAKCKKCGKARQAATEETTENNSEL